MMAIRRFGWVTGIRPEKIEYYKQLHGEPVAGGCRDDQGMPYPNYSIFLKEIGGKHYLFSYLEYVGDDFAADMSRMAPIPKRGGGGRNRSVSGAAARRRCRGQNLVRHGAGFFSGLIGKGARVHAVHVVHAVHFLLYDLARTHPCRHRAPAARPRAC